MRYAIALGATILLNAAMYGLNMYVSRSMFHYESSGAAPPTIMVWAHPVMGAWANYWYAFSALFFLLVVGLVFVVEMAVHESGDSRE